MSDRDVANQLRDAERKREQLFDELSELHARDDQTDAGVIERVGNTNRGIVRVDEEIRELEAQAAKFSMLRERAADPRNIVSAMPTADDHDRRHASDPTRDEALRSIERIGGLSAEAGDRLADLVERDRLGHDARYLSAVSSEHYASAFWKRVSRGELAAQEFTPAEAEAVRSVAAATAERAMATGIPGDGGYAIPAQIDPTIILSSDGSANPIRALARVVTTTSNLYRPVTSDGVTAEFGQEASEVSDVSPDLLSPQIKPERMTIFCPVSFEILQDYGSLQSELGVLFQDAKDNLEADKFVNGTGSDEPQGLLVGITKHVTTAGSNVIAIGDLYKCQEDLGPRWQPRASWLMANATANTVKRLVGSADPNEPQPFSADGTRLIGKPWYELSTLPTTAADWDLPIVFGDVAAGYRIVDRIGMSVEVVGNLFGSNRLPTAQRGLLAFARVGAAVVVPDALRVLRLKS